MCISKKFGEVFPKFNRIFCQNCNNLKISGPFVGDNRLKTFEFEDCPNLSMIRKAGQLNYLTHIKMNQCPYLSMDLSLIQLPALQEISIDNSPYSRLKKSSTLFPSVERFHLNHSNYSQIFLLSSFSALQSCIISDSAYVQIPDTINQSTFFQSENSTIIDPETLQQIINENLGLKNEKNNNATNEPKFYKVCPYCGKKIGVQIIECSNCGAQFK